MNRISEPERRRRRLARKLRRERLSAFVTTDGADVRYLSGFTGEDSALVVTVDEATLVTDRRFEEQSARECGDVRIVLRDGGLAAAAAKALPRRGRAGFDPRTTSVAMREGVEAGRRGKMRAAPEMVREIRQVKSPREVEAIGGACRVAIGGLRSAVRAARAGVSERAFAASLEYQMRSRGASGGAFETIALVDERGSLPHGHAGGRRLRQGGAMLVDWGAVVAGYRSDLTRIVGAGRVTAIVARLHRLVCRAQRAAMERIRPGVLARSVDAAARRMIEEAGFGERFSHGLGHGVGLDVHELPVLSKSSQTRLREGMVFSVEPGIYLPGEAGVRIEDLVVVTRDGCRRLTRLSREIMGIGRGTL